MESEPLPETTTEKPEAEAEPEALATQSPSNEDEEEELDPEAKKAQKAERIEEFIKEAREEFPPNDVPKNADLLLVQKYAWNFDGRANGRPDDPVLRERVLTRVKELDPAAVSEFASLINGGTAALSIKKKRALQRIQRQYRGSECAKKASVLLAVNQVLEESGRAPPTRGRKKKTEEIKEAEPAVEAEELVIEPPKKTEEVKIQEVTEPEPEAKPEKPEVKPEAKPEPTKPPEPKPVEKPKDEPPPRPRAGPGREPVPRKRPPISSSSSESDDSEDEYRFRRQWKRAKRRNDREYRRERVQPYTRPAYLDHRNKARVHGPTNIDMYARHFLSGGLTY